MLDCTVHGSCPMNSATGAGLKKKKKMPKTQTWKMQTPNPNKYKGGV